MVLNILIKIIFPMLLVLYALVFFVFITSRAGFVNGIRSFVVVTGSMEPQVHVGSLVFTQPKESYMKNDIIAFEQDGRTITHRIISINRRNNLITYNTKGDANNTSDSKEILPGAIVGKSLLIIPFVGSVVTTFRTIPGFIVFILLPAMFYIAFEFKNIKSEIENETEKRIQARNSQL